MAGTRNPGCANPGCANTSPTRRQPGYPPVQIDVLLLLIPGQPVQLIGLLFDQPTQLLHLLLENLKLEQLVADRAYEFLFVVAPLPLTTGVGSPVNPLALV